MSGWPAQADYRDALQHPGKVLRTAALGLCSDGVVEKNKMGVPKARSGAFASVYKLTCRNGSAKALKLFNFSSPDRERRYKEVSLHVNRLGAKRPEYLVDFRYETEGIRIGGGLFPIQTMDWVKGVSFGEWVRQRMAAKDVPAIRKMADLWIALMEQLQAAKIAHGDLQHDNIMVVNDRPILVDYDGMCVPPLEGNEQLEFGKPAYQHPQRGDQKLTLGIDHFAAWIILIGLRAIAAQPEIYQRFVVKPDNENLLFVPEDHSAPAGSKLWAALLASPDADVKRWAAALRLSLDKGFQVIPPFGVDPYRTVRALCTSPSAAWEAIAAEAERLRVSGVPLPKEPAIVGTRIDEARRRVACLEKLQTAAAANDLRGLIAAYVPSLVDDWPAASSFKQQVTQAQNRLAGLDKVNVAAKAIGDGRAFVALWDSLASVLNDVPEAKVHRTAAESWRNRIRSADEFRKLFAAKTASEQALAAAWRAVMQAGPPHPDLSAEQRSRGERAVQCAALLDRLKAVPASPSESGDRALLAAWDEKLLYGCLDADPYRSRIAAAKQSLTAFDNLQRVMAEYERGRSDGKAVVAAASALPNGYAHPLAAKVEEARLAVSLFSGLMALLSDPAPSDLKIAEAWLAFKAAQPKAAERAPLNVKTPCEAALKVKEIIEKFAYIERRTRIDDAKKDVRLMKAWNEHRQVLTGRADTKLLKPRLKLAQRRYAASRELLAAIDACDPLAVRKLAENKELANYPPVVARQEEMLALFEKALQYEGVLKKLYPGGGSLAATDVEFARLNSGLFHERSRKAIASLVTARLRDKGRLTPGQPAFVRIPNSLPTFRIHWAWADRGFVNECLVAYDCEGFESDPAKADPTQSALCRYADYDREGGGFTIVLDGQRDQTLYVTIWSAVDLGWTCMYGPPLNLEPIPLRGSKS